MIKNIRWINYRFIKRYRAILLPLTTYMPPAGAIIMLAGIYYGAQYGGSTTAIPWWGRRKLVIGTV
jgi:hypothetical protein